MTDTETKLRQRIRAVNPGWFTHSGPRGESVRDLLDIWPLPHGRVLFSSASAAASDYIDLYVLDPRDQHPGDGSGREQIKCIGSVESSHGASARHRASVAFAVEWMQGLREEKLRDYDESVLGWLGEMAYRMTGPQLEIVERVALDLPPEWWGTHDNPDQRAGEYLCGVLSALGFSAKYMSAHLG